VYRQQKSELHNIPKTNPNNNTSNKRQTFTSSTTTLLPNNDESIYSQTSLHVTNMPSTSAVSPKTSGSIQINEKTTSETANKNHLSGDIPVLKGENSNLSVMQNNSNTNINNWVPMKNHSVKCNIMLKKMRRGNKRSKSLPAKFR